MVPDLMMAATDLPDEQAVEQWSEGFISRVARACMRNRVVEYHERPATQEESKGEISPFQALQNSVVHFGEILTATQQPFKKQIDVISRKKSLLEENLAQSNDSLNQSNDKSHEQLHFEDPDDFLRAAIELLDRKMQAEKQKIKDLQQVSNDVLIKVNEVLQTAVNQLLGNNDDV